MSGKKVFAVICTKDRGVFAGMVDPTWSNQELIEVEECQMCVYWSPSVKGVVNLAHSGPDSCCKITKPAQLARLFGVTALFFGTAEAQAKWQKCPWG